MIDINLSEGYPTENDDVQLIIQQVDLLFDTNYNEVLGSPYFGTDYNEFLFNTNLSNESIEYQIKSDLGKLQLFGFQPSVSVTILEGTLNDIILVTVGLKKKSKYYEKTYKIE